MKKTGDNGLDRIINVGVRVLDYMNWKQNTIFIECLKIEILGRLNLLMVKSSVI